MKFHHFTLIYTLIYLGSQSLYGFQAPENNLHNAIEAGNLEQVKQLLNMHPTLKKDIQTYSTYVHEPLEKFASRHPSLTPQYVKITRYLITQGARINDATLKKLETLEKQYSPAQATPAPVYTPAPTPAKTPVAPFQPKAAPAPTPTPVPTPTPSSTNTKDLLKQLLEAIEDSNVAHLNNLLTHINLNIFTLPQKEELLRIAADSNLVNGYVQNYQQLSERKKILQLLLNTHQIPLSAELNNMVQKALSNKVGGRSAVIQTPLTDAIITNNTSQAIALIKSGSDVNEPNTTQNTPLQLAVINKNKEVAQLLIEKKAKLDALLPHEKKQLSKLMSP